MTSSGTFVPFRCPRRKMSDFKPPNARRCATQDSKECCERRGRRKKPKPPHSQRDKSARLPIISITMDLLQMFASDNCSIPGAPVSAASLKSGASTAELSEISTSTSWSSTDDEIDDDIVKEETRIQEYHPSSAQKVHRSITHRSRKNRADRVRSIFAGHANIFRSFDNYQVECFSFSEDPFSVFGFRRCDMWDKFRQEDSPDHVVVAIEVSMLFSILIMPVRPG